MLLTALQPAEHHRQEPSMDDDRYPCSPNNSLLLCGAESLHKDATVPFHLGCPGVYGQAVMQICILAGACHPYFRA